MGFWFALEPCTASNGALSFLPGSHFKTDINKRFVRMPEGGTGFEEIQKVERPLGLDDTKAASSEGSEYILETCGAGEYLPSFSIPYLTGVLRGSGLDSRFGSA